jgi:formate transporter
MTKSGQAAEEALSARSFLNAESTESGANGPKMTEMFGFNAYSPQEVATLVQNSGAKKARLPLLSQMMLSILAGAFIGMGALYFVVIRSDPALGYAAKQVLGGVTFCLGLVMVVVAGAELFTGNNLLVMARARGLISTTEVLRNWTIVFLGNLIGAFGLALLVYLSHHAEMNNGAIEREYLNIAATKMALPFWTAFFRGVLCNSMVCLGVWMSMAGRSVIDKVIAIVFPISAFVVAGFEHCIANLYFFSMALLLHEGNVAVMLPGILKNVAAVVAGNAIGGSVLVGLVYYLVYIRGLEQAPDFGNSVNAKNLAPPDSRTASVDQLSVP